MVGGSRRAVGRAQLGAHHEALLMINSILRGGARRMLPVFALAMLLCVVLLSGCGSAASSVCVPAAAAVNGPTISPAPYPEMAPIHELVNKTPPDWQSPSRPTG